uniref:NADH dehydrogenase subunit 1 n=1 Tax=Bannacoris arboreus TaxID=1837149 RepID=UPI002410C164|nr:NADH dehydrogenase subunit 1 [Bannacoris arboreus]WEM32388.1 NADH dehydrogenase subunit 1 [Bannacoris arboreus]
MFLFYYLFLLIMVLLSIAFVTLLERKVLSYMQLRKGPNKLGVMGLLQPFSDGIKLFSKEYFLPSLSNFFYFFLTPIFMMILSFFLWMLYPLAVNIYNFNYGMLMFLCLTGLSVYGLMLAGWSSNSVYSFLGSLRSVAQTISYEVSMCLLMICIFIFIYSFNFIDFMMYQSKGCWFLFLSFPLFFCWLSSCLAETNRSPFDFAEGESELVSGFNTEYGGGGFALIFLSEYSNIIFMSMLTVVIFFGCDFYSMFFFMKWLFIIFWFIWVRATLPRFRYDKLMHLAWKVFLPLSLNYLLFFFSYLFIIIMSD